MADGAGHNNSSGGGGGQASASGGGANASKALPRGVLARSGLPLPAGARLSSSIRAPRDLTLGGKVGAPSKKFLAPNLTPKVSSSLPANGSETRGGGPRWGPRGSGRGRGGDRGGGPSRGRGFGADSRGRGRGRGANLVQLDGIFEAGTAVPGRSWGHSSSGGGDGSSSSTANSKDSSLPKYIPMEQEDCEDTQETINRLTRADFIDDGDDDDDCELPLMIPLTTARYGTTCKVEDCVDPEDAVKTIQDEARAESSSQDSAMDVDEASVDRKKPLKVEKPPAETDPSAVARDLLSRLCLGLGDAKADEEGKVLTVFQLPRLPGPSVASQAEERRVSSKDSKDHPKAQPEAPPQYRLKNLPKGYLGKLQVLRDGTVRMVSGKVTMELQMASELPLYQEIVEIQQRMVVPLAQVENKVVCRLNPNDLVGDLHKVNSAAGTNSSGSTSSGCFPSSSGVGRPSSNAHTSTTGRSGGANVGDRWS